MLQQGLANLEFLVVQDGFHPTPTTELADLVLPAAIWGEKEGTYTNSERRVSKVNKAVAPPGEARSDFDIFLGVADETRLPRTVSRLDAPTDAFDEWGAFPGRLCDYSGISYDLRIKARCSGRRNGDGSSADGGLPDGRPRTAARSYSALEWDAVPGTAGRGYPFILNTGRTVEHWHTRTKTARCRFCERMSPRAWLEMNPRDATAARAAQPRPVT